MIPAHIWTISELTRHIRALLEANAPLQNLWLKGEISNFSRAPSGHLYFTLKDAGATLGCVMWRSTAESLSWRPQQGAMALAYGRISVYAPRGVYQLLVEQLQPAGLGDLYARFEELRERLKAEGLFDPDRKRPCPAFPRTLGLVTSPQAAALRDVLQVLRRRYPLVRVLLAPASVQGTQAPAQIVAALRAVDACDVDLILLVRGGGSLEELSAFNDEALARAIAACRHPVISGVGHETDVTIADFVADLRAPTLSAAAELAVPDQAELRQRLQGWAARLETNLDRRLDQARQVVAHQERVLQRLSPQARIDASRQQVDDLVRRAGQAMAHRLALQRAAVTGSRSRLLALSPLSTLERGYAIVRRRDTGAVVRHVAQLQPGDEIVVQVQDGRFGAVTRNKE